MRREVSLALAACVTLPVAAGMIACRASDQGADARAAELPAAQVAAAARGEIVHVLNLAGQFQPYQVVDVHPKVTGFMVKINVDIGDRVHKGETLAVLEVPELNAQLKGTQYELKRAHDDLIAAQHEVDRAQALHQAVHLDYQRLLDTSKAQPGLVAQQELDDAQSKDLAAEAQVDAAKASAEGAKEHVEVAHADSDRVQAMQNYTSVVAPLDGVITWRYADTGALIQSGTNSNDQDIPIVRLAQSGLLRLRFPVPEDDVRYLRVGDPIKVRVDAIGRSFTGKVVRFTREVNFETRTMETEVDVENQDLSITPGMYANAELPLAQAQGVVTIPVEALVLKGRNQETVEVVDGANRVHLRNVQVGIQGSKLAQITSGLQVGERVILGGQDKYTEGEEVRPEVTPEPTTDIQRMEGSVTDVNAQAAQNSGGEN